MPAQYIQDETPVQVAPPPIIPVPELGEEEALEDIAMAFIASSNSSGSSQDPQTYCEAMKQPDASLWKDTIQNELNSLENMGTFKDCHSLPPGHKAIDCL